MRKVFLSHSSDAESLDLVRYLTSKLAEHRFEIITLNDRISPGQVVREAVQDAIKQSSVVVALITRPSAHVFYEIGYAEGIGKRIVILAEPETHVPADLKAMRMVAIDPYDSSFTYRLLEVLEAEPERFDEDRLDYILRDNPAHIFDLYRDHRATFERIDNRTFERIVAELFILRGLKVEPHSDRSPASFDFVVHDFDQRERVVVEVKKYSASSKISVGQVQQLLGAVVAERADLGLLIAPTEFTRTAVDFAGRCKPRVELWGVEDLQARLHLGVAT